MSENSRPNFTIEETNEIIEKEYGRIGTLTPLPSDRDQNFLLTTKENEKYVLKITGLTESTNILDMQNKAMQHVNQYYGDGLTPCPQVITAVSGQAISTAHKNGQDYPVRLISYLPGNLYADVPIYIVNLVNFWVGSAKHWPPSNIQPHIVHYVGIWYKRVLLLTTRNIL